MNRRTVGDLRPELSRVAATTGFAVTDNRFYSRLNEAQLDLMNEGDFAGIIDRYQIRISGGYLVLPGDLNRLVSVAINNEPMEMRSPWYEYMSGGPGPQDEKGWCDNVLERGETCTFSQIPATDLAYFVLVRGELDERTAGVRPVIIIQGYGDSGEWVRSTYLGKRIDGVAVEIDGDSDLKQVSSGVRFRAVTAVIKPVTQGYVDLWIRTASDQPMSIIARYAPRETKPSYRRYLVPSYSSATISTVLARCRARHVPVVDENDFLLITNVNALTFMFRALQKRDSDDLQGYVQGKALAVQTLKKETEAYQGKSVSPAITIRPRSSAGSMPHLV